MKTMKVLIILGNTGFVKRPYEKGEVKVKDQNQITRYRGSARQKCNLNLSLIKKNPCCIP